DRGLRRVPQLGEGAGVACGAGLGGGRGAGHPHHQVALRGHLAGQAVSLVGLVVGEGVLDVVTAVVVAALTERFAGSAGAVAAVEGDVDAGLVGGVGDRLHRVAGDHSGDTVLEGQRDLVRHGGPPSWGGAGSEQVDVDDVVHAVVLQHDLLAADAGMLPGQVQRQVG